jgi:hypothetical protein
MRGPDEVDYFRDTPLRYGRHMRVCRVSRRSLGWPGSSHLHHDVQHAGLGVLESVGIETETDGWLPFDSTIDGSSDGAGCNHIQMS